MAEIIGNSYKEKINNSEIRIFSNEEIKDMLQILKNQLKEKIKKDDLNNNGTNIDEVFNKLKEKGIISEDELILIKDTVYENLVANTVEGNGNLSETDSKIFMALNIAINNVSENEKINFNEFIKIFKENLIQLGVENSRKELFGMYTDTEAPKCITPNISSNHINTEIEIR